MSCCKEAAHAIDNVTIETLNEVNNLVGKDNSVQVTWAELLHLSSDNI